MSDRGTGLYNVPRFADLTQNMCDMCEIQNHV